VTLVNKDQLDILSTLRESVNEDKVGLEADVERLVRQNKELGDKNRMQLEQVNALLLEKVNMQTEGIGHREKMLQRERDFGDLRASLSGKDLPEDIKSRLLALHEENVNLKESSKTAQAQLAKARSVCSRTHLYWVPALTYLPVHQVAGQTVQGAARRASTLRCAGDIRGGRGEFPLADTDPGGGGDAGQGKRFHCALPCAR
jgi:hypothetical protein